jgi:ribosome maturation factor RimP
MTASTRLSELLSPLVTAAGYDLEHCAVSAAGKRSVVRVLVDKDGGVTLDDVADVSRVISEALDEADEREPDLLEVSSPGVDRPLTEARHWRRNVDRLVEAHLTAGGSVTGRVLSADDTAVTLDVAGAERVLPLADVARGVVQVEFNRKGAPGPGLDDDEGLDDEEGDDA